MSEQELKKLLREIKALLNTAQTDIKNGDVSFGLVTLDAAIKALSKLAT